MTMAAGEKKYKLVLLRHGESTWNEENRFTGWYDCPLSTKGVQEAKEAGQALKVRTASLFKAHSLHLYAPFEEEGQWAQWDGRSAVGGSPESGTTTTRQWGICTD